MYSGLHASSRSVFATAPLASTTGRQPYLCWSIAATASFSDMPANAARDKYRNPVATLQFFEVTPSSTVVEISPGGGWYTEILAPLLAAHGTYYAAHFPAKTDSDYYKRNRADFSEKLESDHVYNRVQLT